ncbi:hypothetical protein [Paludisphaera borealis]|uniref:Uncharacterized protein n=1 Tax=Paludisphaera borealis TaxID=1387353 RepID=A0A1U7CX18_9BACT|nr:hypothetical protein [Paludisphaera borealis]APW63484.1 hypothetical protein BSF38_05055 [Paludisphaera borealis]MDR3623330.1 hypothetical protein [Paludisphaera borealis]
MIATSTERAKPGAGVPAELFALRERILALPATARAELEPLIDDVLEQAEFRGRVMTIARDALERFRLDLAATRFDLEATRRERESLRARLGE